jgi:RNA polymerase sigma factor (sigma-70 family)
MLLTMTANDLDLLRQFTRDQSQDAFTALVNRHVKLVYSAALRQIRSPQLAEDVSQSVFADLARDAGKLSGTGFQPVHFLTAWLYQVTRRTAIDAIRKESRRQLREQIAVEMNNMNATANDWTQIEPLLDDAMDALDETDRSAILLRYFENKTLREVGEALGTSDDAAQKRVSRAVEQLREFFSKRNVTVGASGLAVLISANAVQSAPIGLAATISAAAVLAGTAIHTSTVITATKAIAMTTLQKTLVTVTVAMLAGAGIYEARRAAQLRDQNQALQQQQAPLAEQIQQLQHERDSATKRLADLRDEIAKIKSDNTELLKLRGEIGLLRNQNQMQATLASKNDGDSMEAEMQSWVRRVNDLKQRTEQMPDKKIPELQLLNDKDWLEEGRYEQSTNDFLFLQVFNDLRLRAKEKFAPLIGKALDDYIESNKGQLPASLADLTPYWTSSLDPAVFQRYQLLHTGNVGNFPETAPMISEKAPVDTEQDTIFKIGVSGFEWTGVGRILVNSGRNTWPITDGLKAFLKP